MTESLAIPQASPLPAAIEQALIAGDLSTLSTEHRVLYYQAKCQSLGLNPLSQPFGYLRLNGKLVLYALKDAKEQLRKLHGISLEVLEQSRQDTLYFVRVRAKSRDGRFDEDMGFAEVGNLKGEALGNAMLKAITKAKSRVTLSICGLGHIDETEVESIPEAVIESSPEVQKALDRFHARDAEVKASQEQTAPFVNGMDSSPASPAVQTPPLPAASSAAEPKPTLLMGDALKQAISQEFKRLADQYSTTAICQKGWGTSVDSLDKVRQLKEASLRSGLKRLQAITIEEPPAVPLAPSSEGQTAADGSRSEEDVPSFPPPDGNPPEGPQEPLGETMVNHEHNGLTQEEKVAYNDQCEVLQTDTMIRCTRKENHGGAHYFTPPRPEELPVKLPDRPLVASKEGHISTSDMRILERWCQQHGQAQLFASVVSHNPRNLHGNVLVTAEQWAWLKTTVETLEAMHAGQAVPV